MKRFNGSKESRRSRRRYDEISSLFHRGEANALLHSMGGRSSWPAVPQTRLISVTTGTAVLLLAGAGFYALLGLVF